MKLRLLLLLLCVGLMGCTNNVGDVEGVMIGPDLSDTSVEQGKGSLKLKVDECWMLIDGRMRDMTRLVNESKDGNMYWPYCGKDATALFQGNSGKLLLE